MRILVAEDERDMNRLICQALERAGYGVDACFDGQEALDFLDGAEYDCIILDIMMPRVDGREVEAYIAVYDGALSEEGQALIPGRCVR